MLQFYITRAFEAVKTFFRMIKTILYRQFAVIRAHVRQVLNFSRHAGKAAAVTVQTATGTAGKPSKREDYVRVAGILVSKAFVMRIVLAIVLLAALIIFVVWPFILSHYLTARFYVGDKRVPTWTGQVIVYADKKKTVPMYAGKVEKGLLQGSGEEYDENGVLAYRGAFADGKRTGSGACWDNGTMLYEGELVDGKYNGRGKLYREDELLYNGEFEDGFYQGSGTLYRAGARVYTGEFVKGVPEGTGKSYDDTGRVIYEGGYAAGVYSGNGVWYPSEDGKIEAEFRKGEPIGTVRWSKGGRLYYEGEWADGRPSGYGTLYDRSGRTLYRGEFACGTLDGFSLLGLSTEELREMLGEKHTSSALNSTWGFLLTDAELGLYAQCTMQTEGKDSSVFAVRLCRPEPWDGWFELMPGDDSISFEAWEHSAAAKTSLTVVGGGGPIPAGAYRCVSSTKDGNTLALFYPVGENKASMLEWSVTGTGTAGASAASAGLAAMIPAVGDGTGGAAGLAGSSAMQSLAEALDNMKGTDAVRLSPDENPYYGKKDPKTAIAACKTPEDAGRLLDAMTDYWAQAQTQTALESNLERVAAQLADAQRAAVLGEQGAKAEDLEKKQIMLGAQIETCIAARKEIQIRVEDIDDPALYDLSSVPVLFDPSPLELEQLALVAAAYRQMRTGGNADGVESEVKLMLLALRNAWDNVQTAKELYELSLDVARGVAGSYSMGGATRDDWYAALNAGSDADISFKSAIADFQRQANELNLTLAGWLSRNCGWHTEELKPVYEALLDELETTIREAREAATKATAEEAAKAVAEDANKPAAAEKTENASKPEDMNKPADTNQPADTEKPDDSQKA